jgi:hypothetical protein
MEEAAAADIIMEALPLLAAAGGKEEVAGMDVEVAAHRRR